FAELRAAAPVHKGSVAELLGLPPPTRRRAEAPHYSAFSFEANDIVLRDNETFSSKVYEGFATVMFGRSILALVGEEHRRNRALARSGRGTEARRGQPEEDVITMLVQSESEEDGKPHPLTGEGIYGFARLILTAGSGTTWRQLGILLVALRRDPDALEAVRA